MAKWLGFLPLKKKKEKKSYIPKLQQFMGEGTGETLELTGQPAQTDKRVPGLKTLNQKVR